MSVPQIIFAVIIVILLADFALERFLEFLNASRWESKLPEELKGFYDEERYQKQQLYEKANFRHSMGVSTFGTVLLLIMLLVEGFAFLNSRTLMISENPIVSALLFFGVLFVVSDLLNLPFDIYSIFVIEEKFGFNKTTKKTFVLDKLKGYALGAIVGGGLLALIVFLYGLDPDYFWLYAWLTLSILSVLMTLFYSNLIVPLFNRQTPLPEGELKTAIEKFADKVGFRIDNVFVIDGSKRSSKANAYFTGLGSKKRIVLYDTLIDDMTTDEIVAVLAHEVGHYKKRHVVLGLLLSVIQIGLIFFLFSLFLSSPNLSAALGVEKPNFQIGLIAFTMLYSPISLVTGLFMNVLSRKHEYQADAFAAEYHCADSLISALKKLSIKNLSNLRPHPAYVFFYYSHPTLLQRIEALRHK